MALVYFQYVNWVLLLFIDIFKHFWFIFFVEINACSLLVFFFSLRLRRVVLPGSLLTYYRLLLPGHMFLHCLARAVCCHWFPVITWYCIATWYLIGLYYMMQDAPGIRLSASWPRGPLDLPTITRSPPKESTHLTSPTSTTSPTSLSSRVPLSRALSLPTGRGSAQLRPQVSSSTWFLFKILPLPLRYN